MPALEFFNPTIDRYDRRSAARLFRSLWPDAAVAWSVADHLATSVRIAHAAADACWGVTMFRHGVRLNVGQVETLTFRKEGARFLFASSLPLSTDERFRVSPADRPFYPSVPVPSGVCSIAQPGLVSVPASIRSAHEAYIRAAASFKRSSPFKRSFSPAVLEHIESVLNITLPRPSYAPRDLPGQEVDRLPEEMDCTQAIFEGAKYHVLVNAYERDPRARQLCIAEHGTTCVMCGFSFDAVYGSIAEGFIHVHHLRPLSEIDGKYEVNPKDDLRPVCPNCHAVLHRRVPAFSIEEVQEFLDHRRR